MTLVLLGLDNAGKTTLLANLNRGLCDHCTCYCCSFLSTSCGRSSLVHSQERVHRRILYVITLFLPFFFLPSISVILSSSLLTLPPPPLPPALLPHSPPSPSPLTLFLPFLLLLFPLPLLPLLLLFLPLPLLPFLLFLPPILYCRVHRGCHSHYWLR